MQNLNIPSTHTHAQYKPNIWEHQGVCFVYIYICAFKGESGISDLRVCLRTSFLPAERRNIMQSEPSGAEKKTVGWIGRSEITWTHLRNWLETYRRFSLECVRSLKKRLSHADKTLLRQKNLASFGLCFRRSPSLANRHNGAAERKCLCFVLLKSLNAGPLKSSSCFLFQVCALF